MKKLNLNNQVSEDDEKLISLLKTSVGQERSEEFVEKTLEKFLTFKTKQRIVHKPLKSPLYMMLVISLILMAPVFITFSAQIPLPDTGFELGNFFENIFDQLDSWYTLTPMILVLVLLSVAWIQLDLVKFRNPFV